MDLNNSTVKHVKSCKITPTPEQPVPPTILNSIYVISNDGTTTTSVPVSEDNPNYQAILAWVAEGNTIEPADE
jgi:hypothetical protein